MGSVVLDAVNSLFGQPASHSHYTYRDAPPHAHNRSPPSSTKHDCASPRLDTPMSATAPGAPTSSGSHKTPQVPAPVRSGAPQQPPSPPLGARNVLPQPQNGAPPPQMHNAVGTSPTAGGRQARPSKIKVRDLEHIQSFASEDMAAFSEIRGRSRPRSRDEEDEGPQYEISEMKVEHIIEMVAGLLTKITTTNDQQHEHLHRQPPHVDGGTHLSPQTSSVLAFHGKNVPSITILSYLTRINKYCPTSYEVFLSLLVYFDRMTERVNAGPMQSLREAHNQAFHQNASAGSSRASSSCGVSSEMEGVVAGAPQGTQTATPPSSGSMEKAPQRDVPGTPHSRPRHSDSPTIFPEPVIDPYNLSHFFVVDSFNIHRLVIAGVTCASKFFSDIFYTNSRYAKVSLNRIRFGPSR
jgi:hypothetical protein